MPWKNDRGETCQILLEPPQADFTKNDFLWRLSCAKIQEATTFSHFPGFDRLLTILEGEGIEMQSEQAHRAVRRGEVSAFSGEQLQSVRLLNGPVLDFGLIYDRNRVRAKMHILDFKKRTRSFEFSEKTALYYIVEGSFLASTYPGEINALVHEGDLLRIEEHTQKRITSFEPKDGMGKIIGIELV